MSYSKQFKTGMDRGVERTRVVVGSVLRDFQSHVLGEAEKLERQSKILAKSQSELDYCEAKVERLKRDAEVAAKLWGAISSLIPTTKPQVHLVEISNGENAKDGSLEGPNL